MTLLCWYKRYSIFLISFVNLYEFFPAFICAAHIGSLVNSLCRVNVFNNNINVNYDTITFSQSFKFALSAIVSCDGNPIDNGDDDDPILDNFSEDTRFAEVLCLFFSMYIFKKFNWLL